LSPCGHAGCDRCGLEAFDDEVDAQGELPSRDQEGPSELMAVLCFSAVQSGSPWSLPPWLFETGRVGSLANAPPMPSGLRRQGDFEVLSLLRRVEPALLTPVEVAQQLRTSQSGMTGKLDRLEEQGVIQRTPDPDDRRAIRLGITETGRALIDKAFDTALWVYESMVDGFTPNEMKRLDALLEKLLTRLDELSAMRQPWGAS
jgi:DNA-binding MarR family transcriptional regulator